MARPEFKDLVRAALLPLIRFEDEPFSWAEPDSLSPAARADFDLSVQALARRMFLNPGEIYQLDVPRLLDHVSRLEEPLRRLAGSENSGCETRQSIRSSRASRRVSRRMPRSNEMSGFYNKAASAPSGARRSQQGAERFRSIVLSIARMQERQPF